MKKLERKIFRAIFGILTFFLTVSIVLINIVSYRREYESVRQNLNIVDERGNWIRPGMMPPEPFEGEAPEDLDIENMMFVDNEVYTVDLENAIIIQIFGHGNESGEFDPAEAANEIISSYGSDTSKITNLYLGGYSFKYKYGRSIVIINNEHISSKLRKTLLETVILFLLLEVVIFFVSKLMKGWITKPAREAFDKQRDFIADASHELKTPLAVIMASSDELVADESNRRYVENIKYESERMNKLITGLLDLSKLEQGVSAENFKEENLSKIVEKSCLVYEGVAFEQGVGIDTEIDPDITLSCIKEEIEKLVSTLIDNAVKHSEKGTSIRAKLYRSKKNTVVLEVENTGDPIREGDEEKIFERFYRADKSRNRSENRYGLGLAIAKSIVLNHNGTIKAYSEDGKTIFRAEF